MKRFLIIANLSLLVLTLGFAQSVASFQYDNSPLHLNPALAGSFEGFHRVSLNYRKYQFTSSESVRHFAISQDLKFKINSSNSIGFGFFTHTYRCKYQDQNATQLYTMGAFQHRFGKFRKHHILGAGLGFALNKTFSTDYFDLGHITAKHFNLTGGVFWAFQLNEINRFQLGISVYQENPIYLDAPSYPISIRDPIELNNKITLHSSYRFLINANHGIVMNPSIIYNFHTPFTMLLLRIPVSYSFRDTALIKSIELGTVLNILEQSGILNHNIFTFGLRIKNVSLGISYGWFWSTAYDIYSPILEVSVGYLFD